MVEYLETNILDLTLPFLQKDLLTSSTFALIYKNYDFLYINAKLVSKKLWFKDPLQDYLWGMDGETGNFIPLEINISKYLSYISYSFLFEKIFQHRSN